MISTMISADLLTQMRADLERILPDTAIITTPVSAADGAGGVTETWQRVTGGTVACRVDPVGARSQIEATGGGEALILEYLITLPYDSPAQGGDRLLIGADTYEIRRIAADHSWRVAQRCIVRHVK